MRLGRVGVWLGGYGEPAVVDRARARELESLGYGAVWIGEAPGGSEAFVRAATLLAETERLVVATGIASIWGRDPINTGAAIRTLGEAFPGRFVAGLGVSHAESVVLRGGTYGRPLRVMHDHLEAMRTFDYGSPEPSEPAPVVLGALRERMLRLSGELADGAHPYFVPVEHTRRARALLGEGKLLAPELAVVLESDPVAARRLARTHTGSFYLDAPNYVANLHWLGFDEADLAGAGSDHLVDAIVAWGSAGAIVERITEHLAAGADQVCLQPVTEPRAGQPPYEAALDVLRALAPVLREAGLLVDGR